MIDALESSAGDAPPDLKRTRRERKPATPSPKMDRLPPHSEEAEQGVLGCMLLDPPTVVPACIEKFKGGAEVFYNLRHQAIFDLLVEMDLAKEPIDLLTVRQRLKDKNQLEGVGGAEYLNALVDAVPSAANWSFYADIVREKRLLRRMIRACTEVVGRLYEHEGEVDELMDDVEKEILQIVESRVEASTQTIKDLVHKAIGQMEKLHSRKGELTGIDTGFDYFNKLTDGLHDSEMIVIAARPSMGKTSLAMNIVEHVVLDQNLPVGVFSLEMSAEALVMRLMCSRARVNLRSLREGFMAERDFPKLTTVASRLSKAPLYIDDTGALSILELRAKARRMWQQHGIRLFVIDYLQLVSSTSRRAENRQQEIADISKGIKSLAKELKVPIIALAQLSREIEKEKGRKPRLADLRESGSIEQDADLVAMLYKPESNEDEDAGGAERDESQDSIATNLLIAKQRNGPTGDVRLTFLKGFTRFESAARVGDDDVPNE